MADQGADKDRRFQVRPIAFFELVCNDNKDVLIRMIRDPISHPPFDVVVSYSVLEHIGKKNPKLRFL